MVKLAKELDLGKVFTSSEEDYSSLPVHVSRFVGAFLSTFEIILEKNPNMVNELLQTAFDIFTNSDQSKQDVIVQLLKEYKDWFPFSYMFNRRTGKYPKSSFDSVNQFLNSRNRNRSDSKSVNSEDIDEMDDGADDDTYGDSLADSYAHESFPTIQAPNIMPLKPFSENVEQPREYQHAVQKSNSNDDHNNSDNPMSTNEEYILKSYYDYSSNWNHHHAEEDEDSDRDTTYYFPKPVQKRMTRMKSGAKKSKKTSRKKNLAVETMNSTNSTLLSSPGDNAEKSLSSTGKSVSFADDIGNQSGDIQSLNHIEDSAKENEKSHEDIVQSFDANDFSSPERMPRKKEESNSGKQSNSSAVKIPQAIATTNSSKNNINNNSANSSSSGKNEGAARNPIRISSLNSRPYRSDSRDDDEGKGKLSDDSSIELSDADKISPKNKLNDRGSSASTKGPTTAPSKNNNNNNNGNDWKTSARREPPPTQSIVSTAKSVLRSALSDEEDEEENRRPRANTSQNYTQSKGPVRAVVSKPISTEPRIGDISPPRRLNELSPNKLHSLNFQQIEDENQRTGPDITRFSVESLDNLRVSEERDRAPTSLNNHGSHSKPRYRNPLDASIEAPSFYHKNQRDSMEFQEILNDSFEKTYQDRPRDNDGPFFSAPAPRISTAVPQVNQSPLRRSFEFNAPASSSSNRKNLKEIASSYENDNFFPSPSRRSPTSSFHRSPSSASRDQSRTSPETLRKLKENVKKRKQLKEIESSTNSLPFEELQKKKEIVDGVEITPVNRNILPLEVIQSKTKLIGRDSRTSLRQSSSSQFVPLTINTTNTGANHHPAEQNQLDEMHSPLLPVTTPVLKRISSFDVKSQTFYSRQPSYDLQDDLNQPGLGEEGEEEEDLLDKIQREKREQSQWKQRQSLTIVNISQSMTEQTIYDKPFQELPQNISLPPLSEIAEETGIILEGYLNKKSSSILGQWQRRYFVLKESPIHFCELLIYYTAVESLWGMIPLQLKCTIPIFEVSSVETQGKVQAKGREFVVRFLEKDNGQSRFSFASFFGGGRKSKSFDTSAPAPAETGGAGGGGADSDSHSEVGSVASERHYGGKIKKIVLQADDAEVSTLLSSLFSPSD